MSACYIPNAAPKQDLKPILKWVEESAGWYRT